MKKEKKLYMIINSSNRVPNEVLNLAKKEMEDKKNIKNCKFIFNRKIKIISLAIGCICLGGLIFLLVILPTFFHRPNDLGVLNEYIYSNLKKSCIESLEKYNLENSTELIWIKGAEDRKAYKLQYEDQLILLEENATYNDIHFTQYISKRNIQVDIYDVFSNASEIWENETYAINYCLESHSALFYIPLAEYDYYFNFSTNDLEILKQIINTLFEV